MPSTCDYDGGNVADCETDTWQHDSRSSFIWRVPSSGPPSRKFGWHSHSMQPVINQSLVINMDSRPDRMRAVQARLLAAGVVPTRVAGVVYDGKSQSEEVQLTKWCEAFCSPAMVGCFMSHQKCWRIAAASSGVTAIFEDDVEIIKPNTFVSDVKAALQELPSNWEIMYLGCFTCGKSVNFYDAPVGLAHASTFRLSNTQISEHLLRPGMVLGSHAYLGEQQQREASSAITQHNQQSC